MISKKLIFLFRPKKDGSLPISLFFRKIFEFPKLRLLLGAGMTASVLLAGCFVDPAPVFSNQETVIVKSNKPIIHTQTNLQRPVSGSISQGYHWYHPAIDIVSELKTPIKPITEGKIKEVNFSHWGYGHKVVIEHKHNLQSLYAHLGEIKVKTGQEVNKDTIIGNIGLTGWTSGPHLHLEIQQGNKYLDPQAVLPKLEKENKLSSTKIE